MTFNTCQHLHPGKTVVMPVHADCIHVRALQDMALQAMTVTAPGQCSCGTECMQALQPRKILSAEVIDAELLKAGVDTTNDPSSNPYQTALAKEPADYFGFIG